MTSDCLSCNSRLYASVTYCPYCGSATVSPLAASEEPPALTPTLLETVTTKVERKSVQAKSGHASKSPEKTPSPVAPAIGVISKPKPSTDPEPEPAPESIAPSKHASNSPPTPIAKDLDNDGGKRFGTKVASALGIVVLAIAAMYVARSNVQEPDACEEALTKAANMLAGGDAANARSQIIVGMASCNSNDQAKAREMLVVADKALAVQSACERSIRQISSAITDRRLLSARSSLDQLETACANSSLVRGLREQIDAGQASAVAAESEARAFIALGDLTSAADAVDKVASSNREFQGLPQLRKQMQESLRAQDATPQPPISESPQAQATEVSKAPLIVTSPAPLAAHPQGPSTQPPKVAQQSSMPSAPATPITPPVSTQAEMAQGFLRDAETALRQMKFDAAKTYVEGALRVDPNNAKAAALARRIKEREVQYLNEETSIN